LGGKDPNSLEPANWVQLWAIVKQYGPAVGLLLVLIYWLARRIDKLLDRNAEIYESHIAQLTQTQSWLLTKLIGPQPSSSEAPTIKQLQEAVEDKQSKDRKTEENKK
jgi:hypothetical protein